MSRHLAAACLVVATLASSGPAFEVLYLCEMHGEAHKSCCCKGQAAADSPTLKVGALGTHKALGLARAKKAQFMLASTSEVYGDPLVHPQPEDYWGNVNPVGPRGVYDESKRFAEAITMAYHRYHGLDTRIFRIFNTYGPRMRVDDGRVVTNFIAQALRGEPLTVYDDGSRTRSFCPRGALMYCVVIP